MSSQLELLAVAAWPFVQRISESYVGRISVCSFVESIYVGPLAEEPTFSPKTLAELQKVAFDEIGNDCKLCEEFRS